MCCAQLLRRYCDLGIHHRIDYDNLIHSHSYNKCHNNNNTSKFT